MRPANVAVLLPDSLDGDVERMTAEPGAAADLADRLWDLASWSAQAGELLGRLDALPPDGPEALAPGFELSAAVLRHLQADPLLPSELLPARWPGAALRQAYDGWDTRYRVTLRDWSRADDPAARAR
ncbi:MAG TPA: PaaX family transcriptional regulator C-terminal domain-containing protein [Solirubrobacteraceae bacterium]|nr:PaaX family transcriptional regulator C-terminal domain-containing protein [Solirubrobacteraceae bacterium]